MATAVVTIMCIVLIVLGGMMMSQGILSSADAAAISIEEIGVRESEIMRTGVSVLRASEISWGDKLRVTVDNTGQTRQASFEKWDFIVHYHDSDGHEYTEWLPYVEATPGNNEWQPATILLDGQPEIFEPGIVNPEEELVILAKLDPPPGDATTGEVIIATPNGVGGSLSFSFPGYTLLTPHSENMTVAASEYYELVEAAPADGAAMTESTEVFPARETGRKLMYNAGDAARPARHLFPLTGIDEIPSENWTVYYRCRTVDLGNISDNEVSFNIDVLVRQADGSVRETLASGVAAAYLMNTETDMWVTKSAAYEFPGYSVVDASDYLEIDYYGELGGNGSNSDGYLQLRIDDGDLAEADQTRIEA